MTIPTFNPPVGASPGTKNKPEIKILEAEFGDGYTQATGDGLNHIRKVVSLQWDVLTETQADTIEAFFTDQKGYLPFLYTLRGQSTPTKWTCKEWDRTWGSPNTVTATLRQSFSLS